MHVHILYSHIINYNPLTTKWYLNKMMCLKFCKFSENALYVDTHFFYYHLLAFLFSFGGRNVPAESHVDRTEESYVVHDGNVLGQ